LLGVGSGGSQLPLIIDGINRGQFKAVLAFHEDLAALGAKPEALAAIPTLITIAMLPNGTTAAASYVLPGAGFAEKRGSLVNVKGRLQRLQRAIAPAGSAREDWEILNLLLGSPFATFEDVFRALTGRVPALAGLTFNKIGDLGIALDAPAPVAA
jgi:NADH-quinone oxidoreductase subunit G